MYLFPQSGYYHIIKRVFTISQCTCVSKIYEPAHRNIEDNMGKTKASPFVNTV